jgi:hypothetical protein
MSVLLPMFPLRMVAYPGEQLNLHIFEPRYKQLINECEANGTTFGLPAFIEEKVMDIGTEIEVLSIDKRYPDGKLDIRTKGTGIFRVLEFFPKLENRLYTGAIVERLEFNTNGDYLKNETILGYLGELYQILHITKPLPAITDTFNTYQIAHLVGFTLEQEYELLTLPEELQRQNFIIEHLEKIVPVAKEMEELRKKVQMNGHFRNILPPKV